MTDPQSLPPAAQAAVERAEATLERHRELEAIPQSVCLGCQEPWPCDAVKLAEDILMLAAGWAEAIERGTAAWGWAKIIDKRWAEDRAKLAEMRWLAAAIVRGARAGGSRRGQYYEHFLCPHGNLPSYPTHALWCDDCFGSLEAAILGGSSE